MHTNLLDNRFNSAALVMASYASQPAKEHLGIALTRPGGSVSTYKTALPDELIARKDQAIYYAERILKFLMWQQGGVKIAIDAPDFIASALTDIWSPNGERAFDVRMMQRIYREDIKVSRVSESEFPKPCESGSRIGGHLNGNRIGVDLGASSITVCVLQNGKFILSNRTHWDPAHQTDPKYHYDAILSAIRQAAKSIGHVDAIGVSAAGVYVNNRVRVASIFRGIDEATFDEQIGDLFIHIRNEMHVPVTVANDGEVAALAGAQMVGGYPVLGLAMGSSLGGGYVTSDGNITSWLNELAFVPIDYRTDAPMDEWSGDVGCCVQYLSQQGALRLADELGIDVNTEETLGGRFNSVRIAAEGGDAKAEQVFRTIGFYLAHAVAHFSNFYDLKHVLLAGGVCAGKAGRLILKTANDTLRETFPHLCQLLNLQIIENQELSSSQAFAAGTLPSIDN